MRSAGLQGIPFQFSTNESQSTVGLDCCSTTKSMDMTARANAAGRKTPFLKWIFKAFQLSIMWKMAQIKKKRPKNSCTTSV